MSINSFFVSEHISKPCTLIYHLNLVNYYQLAFLTLYMSCLSLTSPAFIGSSIPLSFLPNPCPPQPKGNFYLK